MKRRECINLLEVFGFWYRIEFEDGYDPTDRPKRKLNPWKMQIPCRYGRIAPEGGLLLEWYCEGHVKIRNLMRRLSVTVERPSGDDDLTVIFSISDFEEVAGIVRPKRKRKIHAAEWLRLHRDGAILTRQRTDKSQISEAPGRSEGYYVG